MAEFLERSIQKCPHKFDFALMFFILNIVIPGSGTVGSAFFGEPFNTAALVIGIC